MMNDIYLLKKNQVLAGRLHQYNDNKDEEKEGEKQEDKEKEKELDPIEVRFELRIESNCTH